MQKDYISFNIILPLTEQLYKNVHVNNALYLKKNFTRHRKIIRQHNNYYSNLLRQ